MKRTLRRRRRLHRILSLVSAVAVFLSSGCAFLASPPKNVSLESRVADFPTAGLPLNAPAEILFDDHQLPFIVVRDDRDAPLLLGMVHAHLRLGQMELMRHAARGRLAELFGPFLADIDKNLRLLDLDRAVGAMEKSLPADTRAWIVRFVEGINVYKARCERLSQDVLMYGVADKPWNVADVLALGRLASVDVNWFYWLRLLELRGEPGFPEVWKRMLSVGPAHVRSLAEGAGAVPGMSARSGSNAFAVSGKLSRDGKPILACDPHVGLTLPNLWLAVALSSPSLDLAGLCMPGLPAVLVGRNAHAAWGGTNMMALSSTLYDVSGLEASEFSNRTEAVKVRWWFDEEAILPQTPFGPVVTDAPFLKGKHVGRLALKWRGHEPSDEISAFLALNRARDWGEFRAALKGYAVSGQNLVYADDSGAIGRVMAWERIPAAGRAAMGLVADPRDARFAWSERVGPTDLPAIHDPESGMVVSANDAPADLTPPASLFGFPDDRLERITKLIRDKAPLDLASAEAIQQDVLQPSALGLAKAIVAAARDLPGGASGNSSALVARLDAWDGRYDVDSAGAAALEQTAYHLASMGYSALYGDRLADYLLGSPAVYELLAQDVGTFPPDLVSQALAKATEDNLKYKTWGEMHHLSLAHPLGRAPLIGSRYRYGQTPWPGSMNTVMKSAHSLSPGLHEVRYGANARFVTDLGEPSARVCLLGGQDGFLGSPNFMDQIPLWKSGGYLTLPLDETEARRLFTRKVELRPEK